MESYLKRPVQRPEGSRFADPAGIAKPDKDGPRPSFRRLLASLDMDSPEWPCVAGILREMEAAGVEFCEATLAAAQKLGARQWDVRCRADTGRSAEKIGLATASRAIVYYVRRGSLVKIGTTVQPAHRFADLLPDEICAFEPGGQPEEHRRHLQFAHLRRFGEHFAMEEELMAHIAAMRALYGDPDPTWPTVQLAMCRPTTDFFGGQAVTGELVTATEAERRYGIKRVYVRVLVRRGLLRPVGKEGQAHVFLAEEVLRFVAN